MTRNEIMAQIKAKGLKEYVEKQEGKACTRITTEILYRYLVNDANKDAVSAAQPYAENTTHRVEDTDCETAIVMILNFLNNAGKLKDLLNKIDY